MFLDIFLFNTNLIIQIKVKMIKTFYLVGLFFKFNQMTRFHFVLKLNLKQ